LTNGRHSIIDYIVGSLAIWQVVTHLKVIIDDTRYWAMGGNSDHMSLHLRLNFVTKKILPRFKYDKSKVEEYQLALTTNLGNMWVVNLVGHLGAKGLADLLQ
jgi:hypothetical protein